MEAVPCWISHGPDERLAAPIPHVLETVDIPQYLVEDRDEMDRVSIWACAVVIGIDRESHVGFVVRRVKVHTVPAGWKENLTSQTTRAVHTWKSWCFWSCVLTVV